MRKSRSSSSIQLLMFPANTVKPPLPANLRPRLLVLLVKLLRGARQHARAADILDFLAPRISRLRRWRGAKQHSNPIGQFAVHVLYKRPEIPAKKAVPAIAVSVTYSKQEKAANTGSIPVSATMFS
jgi:hypothetical protein